jgi:hypothetical protein
VSKLTGVSPSGPGHSGQAPEPQEGLGHTASVPNAVTCPSCGETLHADIVAELAEEVDLTFVMQIAHGQMIQAKTLAGVVDSFDKMQKAIGKEVGCKTTTLIKALETEGDELRITFRICNIASAGEADRPKRGATRGSVHEHATAASGDAQDA